MENRIIKQNAREEDKRGKNRKLEGKNSVEIRTNINPNV